MTACHALAAESTPQEIPSMKALLNHIHDRRASSAPVEDFAAYERQLRALLAAVERDLVAEELQRHDVNVPEVLINGVSYRQVLRCPDTYLSLAGEIRVERSLYRNTTEGEHTLCPMELSAGIVEGYWSPEAAKLATYSIAQMTPGVAADFFERVGGMTPSKRSLDRLPKGLSAQWEAQRETFEIAIREQRCIPEQAVSCCLSLDGVMTPMRDGERRQKRQKAEEEGKETRGPAGYREVGCASVSFYDEEGERLQTWRYARMPESKKETLKAWLSEEFKHLVETRPELTTTAVADGAKDNWTYLDSLPLDEPGMVDIYHAREHLKKAFENGYGKGNPRGKAQYAKYRKILKEDPSGVEKVIRALAYLSKKHPRRKILARELAYFRKNRHRMRYAEQREKGLPIGSGVIEASCKTLVTQRLKCSGMRWTNEGGQAVLTWRALIQSEDFDRGFGLIAEIYKADIEYPENVIPFSARR